MISNQKQQKRGSVSSVSIVLAVADDDMAWIGLNGLSLWICGADSEVALSILPLPLARLESSSALGAPSPLSLFSALRGPALFVSPVSCDIDTGSRSRRCHSSPRAGLDSARVKKENVKKLFGQYVQFNAAQLQKGKGSGLGLWITKGKKEIEIEVGVEIEIEIGLAPFVIALTNVWVRHC